MERRESIVIKQPIIVAAPARSGTTMIAGLLAKHGVWIGNAKVTKHPETNVSFGTENIELKNVMKSMAKEIGYRDRQTPLPQVDGVKEKAARLRKEAERIVPKNTTWLVKTAWTLMLSEVWQEAFPDARWVLIRRKPRMVVKSMKQHPQMRKHAGKRIQILKFIRLLHQRQVEIATVVGNKQCLFIGPGAVVRKNIRICKELLAFCGLELNEKVLDDWIQPERWSPFRKRRFVWLGNKINEEGYKVGAEIGVARGVTTTFILHKCLDVTLYAVDIWSKNGGVQYRKWDWEAVRKEFHQNTARYKDRVQVLEGLSWEMADEVEDGTLDFVFIDADHEYESVVKDIKAWTPKLKDGAMLSGHDTHFDGVLQAINELIPNWKEAGVDHVWYCEKEEVQL